jgi:DNA-binding NtrC family response regulator
MKRILIVDDDPAVTNYLMVFLMQTGLFETTVVNDSREVAGLLGGEAFDIVLLDMDMPNVSGMDILNDMRNKGLDTPVVVLTGVSDVDLAVRAMKLGAFDYLIKPADDEKLLTTLNNAMEHSVLHRTIDTLPDELTRKDLQHEAAFDPFTTRDHGMIRLFHQAERLASGDPLSRPRRTARTPRAFPHSSSARTEPGVVQEKSNRVCLRKPTMGLCFSTT